MFGSSEKEVFTQMVLKLAIVISCCLQPPLFLSVSQDWFSSFVPASMSNPIHEFHLHLNLLEPVSVCNQEL